MVTAVAVLQISQDVIVKVASFCYCMQGRIFIFFLNEGWKNLYLGMQAAPLSEPENFGGVEHL